MTVENKYDPCVWFQTSAKHRLIARLPEGCTSGVNALIAAKFADVDSRAHWSDELKDYWRQAYTHWALGLGEWSAGDQYCRCYAPESDRRKLSRDEFDAFKKAGGGPYGYIHASAFLGKRPKA